MNLPFKASIIRTFIRLMRQQDVMAEADRQFALRKPHTPELTNHPSPYSVRLGMPSTTTENRAVFITSRFRSGSTLLWNIFRQLDQCTAYYEPFNERRWFAPSQRGSSVDRTHRGVTDYWREYEGLQELGHWYREDWIREGLYMDCSSHDAAMRNYIRCLIERSKGTAVLQFNRVDFRLPWLRAEFPNTPIIHLYRHPRNQWLSFLGGGAAVGPDQVESSYRDAFYLDVWCKDLARHFPFLSKSETPHPYQRFYFVWKLSWLFGQKHAQASISFEELTENPQPVLEEVLGQIGWQPAPNLSRLDDMLSAPDIDAWMAYADDEWFSVHEQHCERVISRFLNRCSTALSS